MAKQFLFYVDLYKRLVDKDPRAAKQEFLTWWTDDKTIFARLRIWASGNPCVLTSREAGLLINSLDDDVFWDRYHEKDLMLVLAKRWNDYPLVVKKQLEKRLLRGRPRWNGEKESEYIEGRAWWSLCRIHWMATQGCRFSFNLDKECAKLRILSPEWKEEHATHVVVSTETRVGWVRTNTDPAALMAEPLETLLSKAEELSERTDSVFVENKPFAGLSMERPVRAFSALTNSARRNEYPAWAWMTFLDSEKRKVDKPRFSALIAERISRLPVDAVSEFIHSISRWLQHSSKDLLTNYPDQFSHIWTKLIDLIRSSAQSANSSAVRSAQEPDWTMEAINAPVGNLAEALMNDPVKEGLLAGQGFPRFWLSRVEELLSLDGDQHRYALVIFAFNLNWFFSIDPSWTETNLLTVLDQDNNDDKNAFWAGYFWGAGGVDQTLELCMRLKYHLIRLACQESNIRRNSAEVMSTILLAGWVSLNEATGERCITDAEMRDVLINADDDFRSNALWHLNRWLSGADSGRWREELPTFLSRVWPRHIKAKSPRVSAKLCNLAFSDVTIFPRIVDIVISLVTNIDRDHIVLPEDNIIDQYPERVLALLYIILPENVSLWPYDIESTIARIGASDPSLLRDSRMIELKRRWDARK